MKAKCECEPNKDGEIHCGSCKAWDGEGGYEAGATVSYNGCCWISPGIGVNGYDKDGNAVFSPEAEFVPMAPGTEFSDQSAKNTLWKKGPCTWMDQTGAT